MATWWSKLVRIAKLPVHCVRAVVDGIARIRRFLDERRRDLAVGIIVAMMVVVGVKLRHSGFADQSPGGFVSLSFPADPEVSPSAAETESTADNHAIVPMSGSEIHSEETSVATAEHQVVQPKIAEPTQAEQPRAEQSLAERPHDAPSEEQVAVPPVAKLTGRIIE